MDTSRTHDELRVKASLQAMAETRSLAAYSIQLGSIERFANESLFPAELSAIASAAPRRVATFRAGRACARAALKELGAPPIAIPIGKSGAPIWPQGFVGSITHTDEIAAAIVTRTPPASALGLDLESDQPLDDPAMLQLICRPEELPAARDLSDPENLKQGKLLFVVKEAVYKLYAPLTSSFLEFHDLTIALDEPGNFRATLVDPKHPALAGSRTITGAYAKSQGLFLALASLPWRPRSGTQPHENRSP